MAEEHYLKEELYRRLQTEPALFAFLQSGALDGIWYWDLTDQSQWWMSPRVWEVLGYPPEQPPAWRNLLLPEDAQATLDAFQAQIQQPAPAIHEQIIRYRHATGRTVWIRCRSIILRDGDGVPLRMLSAHTDISALKEAQQQLTLANRQLQQRSDELTAFATIASHDLKAPVRQLASLAELLQLELAELDVQDDTLDHIIGLITRRAAMAVQMHDDLLAYATAGGAPAAVEPIDLDALVREVWLAHQTPGFSLHLPAPLPTARLPRVPVVTVLSNLFSNAVQHHDRDHGTVSVTAAAQDGLLVLSVADDGPGIPDTFRDKVFEAFKTLQSRDSGGGTGLGMALVQKLTERFGEGTTLHSNTPRGTRFETRWHTR